MNPIYIFSPYLLNENPKALPFTLGQRDLNPSFHDTEQVGLTLYVDRVARYTTGPLTVESLKKHVGNVSVHRRRKTSVKLKLEYVKRVRGFNYAAVVPVYLSLPAPLPSGVTQVRIAGSSSQVSGAIQNARARFAGVSKKPRTAYFKFAKSRPVRPSPEIVNRQFLKITEVGVLGTLSPAQSGREVIPVLSYQRDWTGTRTPGFQTLKKRQLPVNPHTVAIKEVLEDRFSEYSVNTHDGAHTLHIRPFSDKYAAPGDFDRSGTLAEADFKAMQRLIGKAQAGIQANIGQNIAQGNLVAKMVLQNASQIIQSLRQLKRGNIPGAISALNSGRSGQQSHSLRKSIKGKNDFPPINPKGLSATSSLASNWLALQYGWKPLLKDIQGLLLLLPNLTAPTGFVHRVKSSASASAENSEAYPPGDATIGSGNSGLTTWVNRCSVKYIISYRVDDAATAFFAQTGLTDPISLAWELLPFSFVADWFLPIGSYLEMRNAYHGLTFLQGSKTTCVRTFVASDVNFSGTVSGVPQTLINRSAVYRKQMVNIARSRITSWPSPIAPTFNLNPFKNSNIPGLVDGTNDRALNAVALLQAVFRK